MRTACIIISLILAITGAACLLPIGHALLDFARGWAIIWSIAGIALALVGVRSPVSATAAGIAVFLHLLTLSIWWVMGGMAYFGASP